MRALHSLCSAAHSEQTGPEYGPLGFIVKGEEKWSTMLEVLYGCKWNMAAFCDDLSEPKGYNYKGIRELIICSDSSRRGEKFTKASGSQSPDLKLIGLHISLKDHIKER